ncbi:MAG TPA: acetyl-CoA carboxylase biotin carboxyl carrier protein subunit [Pedobacter sp.]|jgi:biotin carboxyl carrier protein
MNTVKVNDQQFELKEENGLLFYKGQEVSIDIREIDKNYFHALYNNNSFKIELIDLNRAEKILELKINNKKYSVKVTDQYDELLHKLGFDKALSQKISDLKAPMPGLVLKVLVKDGDTVLKGDNLIILEAMKMENIIKSPIDGTLKSIKIQEGDKLEKNQVMIVF